MRLFPSRPICSKAGSGQDKWNETKQKKIKVAPFSFLTARELVSKPRDNTSIKKSTRKLRAASTSQRVTRTGRILAAIVAHFLCASHP